jgi:predicted nucleotidyltransferase
MTKEEIEQNLIFLFVRGSQAYGTNTPESDEDFGGVCLPSTKVILGFEKFEQDEKWIDGNGQKIDKAVYNVTKIFDLLCNSNPNIIDFAFAPEHCIRHMTPEWEKIIAIRDAFISKKAKWSYQGYAKNQLDRISTHRSYLLNPAYEKPTRAAFNLPEESIFPQTQLDVIARISSEYAKEGRQDAFFNEFKSLFDHEGAIIFKNHIKEDMIPFAIADFKKGQKQFLGMISSISGRFLKDEYEDMAKRELAYLAAKVKWKSYLEWKSERNEKRKILEAKCGYDAKHAMHLIRLLRMSVEIMSGEGIKVDRRNIDRDHLMEIRLGNVSFDDVLQEANDLREKGNQLYAENPLQVEPNMSIINPVLEELLLSTIRK